MSKPETKKKSNAGRPKAIIDWNKVGQMLEAGCTAEGIAATIGVSREVLYRRCEDDNKVNFSTFSQEKRSRGDDLLRAKQFETAMRGNVVMQIWLGKQRLGQREKSETDQNIKVERVEESKKLYAQALINDESKPEITNLDEAFAYMDKLNSKFQEVQEKGVIG